MIEIIDSPGHLIAMKLSGGISASDVSTAYSALERAMSSHDRVSFFADVDDSMSLSFEGIVKDVVNGLSQLGKLGRYYRAAVVTDKKWLAALARAEGLVFAWMEIRVFPRSERDAAFEWASVPPEPIPEPVEPPPAISFIPTNNPNVIAYDVNGRITEKNIAAAVKEVGNAFDRSDRLNVLGRITNLKGFDVRSVLRQDLFDMKSRALKKVDKYAVVGAPSWLRNFLELIDPMFNVEIRVYDAAEENAAWDWLGARPV